jgi:hypothetical protein
MKHRHVTDRFGNPSREAAGIATSAGRRAIRAIVGITMLAAAAGCGAMEDASASGSTSEHCAAVTASIAAAGFGDSVKVTCDSRYAYIVSDTYPSHPKMIGITGTNDQVPVPAPGYTSPIALAPVKATKVTSIDAALGVAVNGVPIYDYTSQGLSDPAAYDPLADTKLTGELDMCGGHAGRGDDYHYHVAPSCMISAMKNQGPSAILGWAFDGYPIYGNQNPDGTTIAAGELDVCNAKADTTFGYRYHTSDKHPYIIQCLVGEIDLSLAPRVAPLSATIGGGKPPGNKPPGGVTNLRLVEATDGTRTMTYDHAGKAYSIKYKPSSTASCWDFTEASFSTGGAVTMTSYCRRSM